LREKEGKGRIRREGDYRGLEVRRDRKNMSRGSISRGYIRKQSS
jgi:hypothetical protein